MSHPTLGPGDDVGESSVQPSGPPLVIPQRTSSRRVSNRWDSKFAGSSTDEIAEIREKIGKDLSKARKNFKRKASMDEEYWGDYLKIARLHQDNAQVESQIGLRQFTETRGDAESWYDEPDAQRFKLQYDSWRQWDSIMSKHAKRLQKRFASSRETFVRLFSTSSVGLGLKGGMNDRDSSEQSNFADRMLEKYCPDPPAEHYRWDPVLQEWKHSDLINAAHLFPWRQAASMDQIFGKEASKELFEPVNGLFLHKIIEKALENGFLAIVPDIDLEPADRQFPLNDQKEREDRVKEWQKQKVQDYKIIVVNKVNKEVTKKKFTIKDAGIETLGDLDGRKLVFKTDFRPRARYVWWTYLNTILRTAWSLDCGNDRNIQHQEVRKATRYWGTRGRYIKENQLLGFVEEIGHDVKSLLGQEDGQGIQEHRSEAEEEIGQDAENLLSQEDEQDTRQSRPEAVHALVHEVVLRSGEADYPQGKKDNDEEIDSYEEYLG